jgi:hypothetical protein
MTTLVVLFNLKPGVDAAAYEQWARTTDLPIVNKLPSVAKFSVFKAQGLLGGAGPSPYQYVEIIDVKSMEQLGQDISTPSMQRVAGEFQQLADNPTFIVTESL